MKVFLETSIQIQRLLHTDKRKAEIHKQIAGKQVITSTYVYMEFRRSIIQSLTYLQTLLRNLQNSGHYFISFADFLIYLSEAPAISHSPRNIQRAILVSSTLWHEFRGGILPVTEAIDTLDFQIEAFEKEAFFEEVDEVINSTDCDLAKPTKPIGNFISTRLSCNANTARCRLVSFLSSQRTKLVQLENMLSNLPPQDRDNRVLVTLRRLLSDTSKALGERTCWPLGDIIIALECPEDAAIYTRDKQFRHICRALGKTLFREL